MFLDTSLNMGFIFMNIGLSPFMDIVLGHSVFNNVYVDDTVS